MAKGYSLLTLLAVLLIAAAGPGERNAAAESPAGSAIAASSSGVAAHSGSLIHMTMPLYPAGARNADVNGTVRIEAWVGKDGKVVDAQVLSGPNLLRKAALDAVRRWQYEPTILDGKSIDRIAKIEIEFLPRPQ